MKTLFGQLLANELFQYLAVILITGKGPGIAGFFKGGSQGRLVVEISGFHNDPDILQRRFKKRFHRICEVLAGCAGNPDQPFATKHADGKGLVLQPGLFFRHIVGIEAHGGKGVFWIHFGTGGKQVSPLTDKVGVRSVQKDNSKSRVRFCQIAINFVILDGNHARPA